MKIGIDIDDTICSTREKLNEYIPMFTVEKNITIEELWGESENKKKFLEKYLEKIYTEEDIKPDASRVINKLYSDGNEIIFITARRTATLKNVEEVTKKYLEKYNIPYHKIIFDSGDKVDICKEEKIDVMIEDNLYNCNKLKDNNIPFIRFEEEYQENDIDKKIKNWQELEEMFYTK